VTVVSRQPGLSPRLKLAACEVIYLDAPERAAAAARAGQRAVV
jgi:hypothetical protein